MTSLVVRGIGSEKFFDMKHDLVKRVIDKMRIVDIYDLAKLSLFVKSHTPVADDSFFCATTGDIVTEAIFHFVSVSSDGGRGKCGLDGTGDTFAIDALFDGFLLEYELIFIGDDLSFGTTASDLVFWSFGLE